MVSVWAAHFQLLPSRTQTEVSKAWRGLGLPALLDLLVDFIGHCDDVVADRPTLACARQW